MVPSRLLDAARRRYLMLRFRGDRVVCPCCERRFREFLPRPRRRNVTCPNCGARERQRLLLLYLRHRTDLFERSQSVLHFAPEYSLERHLRGLGHLDYVTTDLESPNVTLNMDITDMRASSGSFDLIICSHVLEHVPDDHAAIRELFRVLKPGGTAIVMVPQDLRLARTREDRSVTDPAERRRLYGHSGHVRVYGRDLVDRLGAAGFEVSMERFADDLGADMVARYGLRSKDEIFRCVKPAPLVE